MHKYQSPKAEFLKFAVADIVTASEGLEYTAGQKFDPENPLGWYNHFYDENGNLRTDL